MLTGVFLLVIFMIIIYYEARLRSGEYGMMEYRPQMMHYENITTPDWNEWEQESDGYWQKFDHRIAAMMEHNNRVFQNLETLPTSENPIGKYSGTKVVNNDSFTYSLEVGTGSLTGSISGTDSGTIESVVKDISNLGYKVSKVD